MLCWFYQPHLRATIVTHYLIIDQGGQASRAFLFSTEGQTLAHARQPVATRRPRCGWVEQDAEQVLAATEGVIERVLGHSDRTTPVTVALTCQRASVLCWHRRTGQPLSPVISWQDTRNAALLEELPIEPAMLRRRTGLFASAHYGASKLAWCWQHLPDVRRAAAEQQLAWGPLASFLVYRLVAGQPYLVDFTLAQRTLLWSLASRDWDENLLGLFRLPAVPLPRCVPSRFDYGPLDPRRFKHAALTLKLVMGDQPASLFAAGPLSPTRIYVNIGTGAFVQALAAHADAIHPRQLCSLIPGEHGERFIAEGTVNGAASALQWLAGRHPHWQAPDSFDTALGDTLEPALFFNTVGGLGSPYWQSSPAPFFKSPATPLQEWAGVLESILFLIQINIDLLPAGPHAPIIISGGLSRSDAFCARLADLSQRPVERSASVENTVYGALQQFLGTPAERPATVFVPRPDPVLQHRFDSWRRMMAEYTGYAFELPRLPPG